jgi:hypothetical protein
VCASGHSEIRLHGGVQDERGVGRLLEGAGLEAVDSCVVLRETVGLGEGLRSH